MDSNNIKRLRTNLDLSQERFAHLLGVSLQTVRRWEKDLTKPLPIIRLRLEELEKEVANASRETSESVVMTEKERMGGQAEFDFSYGDLFKGISNLFDLVSKMSEEAKGEYVLGRETGNLNDRTRGVYGFNIRIGAGGKPIIEHFGNLRATEEGAVVAEVSEPIVDVMDEGERVVIIAELPGVDEKDIHLKVKDDILDLATESEGRKYGKEILLPSAVDTQSIESFYRNGVLEIKLRTK